MNIHACLDCGHVSLFRGPCRPCLAKAKGKPLRAQRSQAQKAQTAKAREALKAKRDRIALLRGWIGEPL